MKEPITSFILSSIICKYQRECSLLRRHLLVLLGFVGFSYERGDSILVIEYINRFVACFLNEVCIALTDNADQLVVAESPNILRCASHLTYFARLAA